MIKVEVIEEFTLKDFNKLKKIERKNLKDYGRLYVGDKFECEQSMADYLLGDNPLKKAVVKVIEIEPLKSEAEPIVKEKAKEELDKTFEEIGKAIDKNIIYEEVTTNEEFQKMEKEVSESKVNNKAEKPSKKNRK